MPIVWSYNVHMKVNAGHSFSRWLRWQKTIGCVNKERLSLIKLLYFACLKMRNGGYSVHEPIDSHSSSQDNYRIQNDITGWALISHWKWLISSAAVDWASLFSNWLWNDWELKILSSSSCYKSRKIDQRNWFHRIEQSSSCAFIVGR